MLQRQELLSYPPCRIASIFERRTELQSPAADDRNEGHGRNLPMGAISERLELSVKSTTVKVRSREAEIDPDKTLLDPSAQRSDVECFIPSPTSPRRTCSVVEPLSDPFPVITTGGRSSLNWISSLEKTREEERAVAGEVMTSWKGTESPMSHAGSQKARWQSTESGQGQLRRGTWRSRRKLTQRSHLSHVDGDHGLSGRGRRLSLCVRGSARRTRPTSAGRLRSRALAAESRSLLVARR